MERIKWSTHCHVVVIDTRRQIPIGIPHRQASCSILGIVIAIPVTAWPLAKARILLDGTKGLAFWECNLNYGTLSRLVVSQTDEGLRERAAAQATIKDLLHSIHQPERSLRWEVAYP